MGFLTKKHGVVAHGESAYTKGEASAEFPKVKEVKLTSSQATAKSVSVTGVSKCVGAFCTSSSGAVREITNVIVSSGTCTVTLGAAAANDVLHVLYF